MIGGMRAGHHFPLLPSFPTQSAAVAYSKCCGGMRAGHHFPLLPSFPMSLKVQRWHTQSAAVAYSKCSGGILKVLRWHTQHAAVAYSSAAVAYSKCCLACSKCCGGIFKWFSPERDACATGAMGCCCQLLDVSCCVQLLPSLPLLIPSACSLCCLLIVSV